MNDRGGVKLSDFGAGRQLQTGLSVTAPDLAGTPQFMAPEQVRSAGHGFAAYPPPC